MKKAFLKGNNKKYPKKKLSLIRVFNWSSSQFWNSMYIIFFILENLDINYRKRCGFNGDEKNIQDSAEF